MTALLLASTLTTSASAESRRCDGGSAGVLEVYCERADRSPVGPRPTPATRLSVLDYGGDFPLECASRGYPGIIVRYIRTTIDGRVVSDRPVCRPSVPAGVQLPYLTDSQTSEQVRSATPWPTPGIGIEPDRRGLVAYPFGVFATGPRQLVVDVALSDGTRATSTAAVAAWSIWVDGDLVASTSEPGRAGAAALAYVWATSGTKEVRVVATWMADLQVTFPDGSTESRDLEPVDVEGARDFVVEQVQSVIDYSG